MSPVLRPALLAALACALGAGCKVDQTTSLAALSQKKDLPVFPADSTGFVRQIDNPFLAFAVGRVFHYTSETPDGVETNVVQVTNDTTKRILGIVATVVHDQLFLNDTLVEDTFDWYAQDTLGNVWYLGEDSKQLQNGVVVGTEGSWEAGVNGATAGIIMLAQPQVGMQYQQELAAGVAEDMAKVSNLSATAQVPFTSCTNCLKTEEWSPLEPGARESKFYKPGVGLLLELEPKKGGVRNELTAVEH